MHKRKIVPDPDRMSNQASQRRRIEKQLGADAESSIARAAKEVQQLRQSTQNGPVEFGYMSNNSNDNAHSRTDVGCSSSDAASTSSYSKPGILSRVRAPVQKQNTTIQRKDGFVDRQQNATSVFRQSQTTPLDPSLLRPTSLIEQENNILIAQDIGKSYQLAVKDYALQVRDNRIRAKDAEIAELNGEIDLKDGQLSAYYGEIMRRSTENQNLMWLIALRNNAVEEQKEEIEFLEYKVQGLEDVKMEYYDELADLRKGLEASQSIAQDLKNRRLIDNILRWLRSMLPADYAPTWIQEDKARFPLMKCPGEIRNAIYKHALVLHHPIDFWPILPPGSRGVNHLTQLTADLKHINISLLRVSHQVHQEAAYILYGCNRFRFSDRGGWTILSGFLFHIARNASYLTSIAATYPEWCSAKTSGRPLDESEYCLAERAAVLKLFGNTQLDSPTGASSESSFAYKRAGEALMKLPNLRRFDFVVPHDVRLYAFGVDNMVRAFTSLDRHLTPHALWAPTSRPVRGFVIVRRNRDMRWVAGHTNLDDDVVMGRAVLMASIGIVVAQRLLGEVRLRTARYGTVEDRMGYVLDEGEQDIEADVPEYVDGDGWGLVSTFKGVKRLFMR